MVTRLRIFWFSDFCFWFFARIDPLLSMLRRNNPTYCVAPAGLDLKLPKRVRKDTPEVVA